MSKCDEFYGKTWIYVAQASIFGMFGVIGIIFGLLSLFGIARSADGRPMIEAGIPSTIMGIAFLGIAAVAIIHIRARSEPIIRILDQGLEIKVLGSTVLDSVPVAPIGLTLLFHGLRNQVVWVPWSTFRGAEISGFPIARTLTIFAVIYSSIAAEQDQQPPIASRISFGEHEFVDSLDEVAATICGFAERYGNPNYR